MQTKNVRSHNKYTPEFKAAVAIEALSHQETLVEVAKKNGITEAQVKAWRQALISGAAKAFQPPVQENKEHRLLQVPTTNSTDKPILSVKAQRYIQGVSRRDGLASTTVNLLWTACRDAIEFFGDIPVEDVSEEKIAVYKSSLLTAEPRFGRKPASASATRSKVNFLRRLCSISEEELQLAEQAAPKVVIPYDVKMQTQWNNAFADFAALWAKQPADVSPSAYWGTRVASWEWKQRKHHKAGKLEDWKIQKLKSIGYVFAEIKEPLATQDSKQPK